MASLGPAELIIILVIVVIIFGVGKLPEIGSALGKGVREFKDATEELEGASEDMKEVASEIDKDK